LYHICLQLPHPSPSYHLCRLHRELRVSRLLPPHITRTSLRHLPRESQGCGDLYKEISCSRISSLLPTQLHHFGYCKRLIITLIIAYCFLESPGGIKLLKCEWSPRHWIAWIDDYIGTLICVARRRNDGVLWKRRRIPNSIGYIGAPRL
jgi:hypothetical protein